MHSSTQKKNGIGIFVFQNSNNNNVMDFMLSHSHTFSNPKNNNKETGIYLLLTK